MVLYFRSLRASLSPVVVLCKQRRRGILKVCKICNDRVLNLTEFVQSHSHWIVDESENLWGLIH